MSNVDKQKVESLVKWWMETDTQGMDVDKYLITPLMESFGEDVAEILEYLDAMDEESLLAISGCFEDIYRKFTTDEVWDALETLEQKIA